MSESPHSIIQTGIREGYAGLRPGPNPHALGSMPRSLWDVGWTIGDQLRRRHERELELELEAIEERFRKAMK